MSRRDGDGAAAGGAQRSAGEERGPAGLPRSSAAFPATTGLSGESARRALSRSALSAWRFRVSGCGLCRARGGTEIRYPRSRSSVGRRTSLAKTELTSVKEPSRWASGRCGLSAAQVSPSRAPRCRVGARTAASALVPGKRQNFPAHAAVLRDERLAGLGVGTRF